MPTDTRSVRLQMVLSLRRSSRPRVSIAKGLGHESGGPLVSQHSFQPLPIHG